MNTWIKAKEERAMAGAVRGLASRVTKIEREHNAFDALDKAFKREDLDLEAVTNSGGLHMYFQNYDGDAVKLYAWNDNKVIRATVEAVLIAGVELFGDAKRSIEGSDIRYTWEGDHLGEGIGLIMEVTPAATGCKLVEKEVAVAAVPAKPATTKKVWEVECAEDSKEGKTSELSPAMQEIMGAD